jgi:hypothetical protein
VVQDLQLLQVFQDKAEEILLAVQVKMVVAAVEQLQLLAQMR